MTTSDVTLMVTWSSSAATIATVSAGGLLGGVAVGNATIRAQLGTVIGSTNATVTAALLRTIAVTPATPRLARGLEQQLTATGTFSDDTTQNLTDQVTWTSGTAASATVSTAGLVTAVGVGTAMITATHSGISGSTMVTVTDAELVSIAITPPTPQVARGRTLQLTATGTFTDATTQNLTDQVTWASGTLAAATIDNAGLVTSVDPGTTMITATRGAITGTTELTVTVAELVSIAVTPPTASVALGRTQQFNATGTFSDSTTQDLTDQVTWTAADETIAVVSNAAGSRGLAATLKVGTAKVSATLEGITGDAELTVTAAVLDSIAVTPTDPSVALGRTQQFVAMGTFSDLSTDDITDEVVWSSSAEAVATISNADGSRGLASTHAVGPATISAALAGITGSTTLTVTAAAVEAIAVTPLDPSIVQGLSQQFRADGAFSDGTTRDVTGEVIWESSSPEVAQISNAVDSRGLAAAIGAGTTTISATLEGISVTTTLTVTAAVLVSIAVRPAAASVIPGGTQQYTALGMFNNGSIQDVTTTVTWATGDLAIAQISNLDPTRGQATGIAVGTTAITATLAGVTGTTEIVVVPPT